MSHEVLLLVTTAVAIVGIVLLITWLEAPPVFALLLGTLFLGVTTDVGFAGTSEAVTSGFADVLGEIGVLITFGVIMGALLTVTDTMQRLVGAMLRVFGERSIPYVVAVALSSLFTSIYSDVLLVLSAPIARRLGPRLGPRGIALMGGALTAGIEVGLVFVAPGVAAVAVAVAGVLGVPLGQMFVFGLLVGVPTAALTMLVFRLALPRLIRWDPAADEQAVDGTAPEVPAGSDGAPADAAGTTAASATAGTDTITDPTTRTRQLPLLLALSPVLVSLALIGAGALTSAIGVENDVVAFVTDPVVAIFVGACLAFLLASRVRPRADISTAVGTALASCGPILILSGISGSLGAVIEGSGLADILGAGFSSGVLPPLLLVWLVAAVLHVALGSISVASITAAGILAPIAGSLGVPVVLVALAAGSGALFLPHVSSFFWMFQSLLGLSVRGTFKTHAVAMSLASLVSLPIVLALGAVL